MTFKDVMITDRIYLLGEDLFALDFDGNKIWRVKISADTLLCADEGILALDKNSLSTYYVSPEGRILWQERVSDWWWDGVHEFLYIKTSKGILRIDFDDGKLRNPFCSL